MQHNINPISIVNKNILLAAISKVFLDLKGVDDYYIFWELQGGKLSLSASVTAFKTTTAAFLELDSINIVNSSFIIRTPDKLIKKLGIAEEEVYITTEKGLDQKLLIKDKTYEQEFILCDVQVVKQQKPEVEEPEGYDFTIEIDAEFMSKFSKAKKADSAEIVAISAGGNEVTFELGEDNSYSNKSRFFVEQKDKTFPIIPFRLLFSADILQEVFDSNKNAVGLMSVCNEGLMKISFSDYTVKPHIITVTYFLVALDTL